MHCTTKKHEIMLQVLNGNYPSVAVSKMDKNALGNFVKLLVKRTSNSPNDEVNIKKPKWWPKDVQFKSKMSFEDGDAFYIRPILKLLVIKCSEYFKNGSFKQKWLPDLLCDKYYQKGENDENLYMNVINRGAKRKNNEHIDVCSTKKLKLNNSKVKLDLPPIEVDASFKNAYVPIEPNFVLIPNQTQFLGYFKLQSKSEPPLLSNKFSTSHLSALKLSSCPQVPFSSDIGRLMTANENCTVSDDWKLRRLEKNEWYLSGNSVIKSSEQEYEVSFLKRGDDDFHTYSFPRRQCHQEHLPLYHTPFIWKHMQSAYVKLEQLDLTEVQKNLKLKVCVQRLPAKELSPYLCKDIKVVVVRGDIPESTTNPIRRYSPRLRTL